MSLEGVSRMKVPMTGTRFLILIGSLAFMLPHATQGHHIHPLGHANPVKVPNVISTVAASEQSAPQDILPDIFIDTFLGDAQIQLERRTHKAGTNTLKYLVIKLEDGRVSSFTRSHRIDLRAMIEGANALQGSLPYAVAWLTGLADPIGSVRALGYDMEVVKEHERPCTDQLPSQACLNLGRRLAMLIDATLSFGSPDERAQFRRDASAIGIAPDCSAQEP